MVLKRRYHIIGACSGWGAQLRACEKGPEDLAKGGVFERLRQEGIDISKIDLIYPQNKGQEKSNPLLEPLSLIQGVNSQITHAVKEALKKGEFPIVLGGDHSIAVGTWNAFDPPFALLWIDAHMDAHTLQTTPSGAFHGMPVAALLGDGEAAMMPQKKGVLQPENLALIGVRSFEKEEAALLKKRNVRIYFMDEVRRRGMKNILPEAIAHITQGNLRFGVSIDLDAFAPEEVPGVGSPEKGGIATKDFLPMISFFSKNPKWMGFELAEFNPERDIEHKSREVVFQILKEAMRYTTIH